MLRIWRLHASTQMLLTQGAAIWRGTYSARATLCVGTATLLFNKLFSRIWHQRGSRVKRSVEIRLLEIVATTSFDDATRTGVGGGLFNAARYLFRAGLHVQYDYNRSGCLL